MRNITLGYFLAILGFFGAAGIHRFYLGKYPTGLLYLLTGGLFGVGTVLDLIRMPTLIEEANLRHLLVYHPEQLLKDRANRLPPVKQAPLESQILALAKQFGGDVTPQMVSLYTKESLKNSKSELESLKNAGFCEMDIAEDGAELYRFFGLEPKKPI